MPITVTAPRGTLTSEGEREILPRLTAALIDVSGQTGNTYFTSLNFGYGSTLAVMAFLIVVAVSFIYIRVLGAPTLGARR